MNDADQSVGEHADVVCRAGAGSKFVGGRHPGSPLSIAVNTPASIIPAILAGRSNAVLAPKAPGTALPKVWAPIQQARKNFPPGGGCPATNTKSPRGVNASFGADRP